MERSTSPRNSYWLKAASIIASGVVWTTAGAHDFCHDLRQYERYGLIQKIVQPASLPHVWVGPDFYKLTYDQKSTLIGTAHICLYHGLKPHSITVVYDGMNGHKIGTWTPEYQLQLK